jgi:hypothetical protein
MLTTLSTALRSLPPGFLLSFPPTASPFDLAQLLLPAEEFLTSVLTSPEATATFLGTLSELCLGVLRLVDETAAGPAGGRVTNRGMWFPGLRLPCDALVNLSPGMLRDMALPVLERFGEAYGKLCIHYCSKPAPSAHVLPPLCESPYVAAVDTWQGPEAFIGEEAPGRMQSRVALVFDADLRSREKMEAFLEWKPIRDVPRQNGRALVLQTQADSVDEAKRIYALWRELTS